MPPVRCIRVPPARTHRLWAVADRLPPSNATPGPSPTYSLHVVMCKTCPSSFSLPAGQKSTARAPTPSLLFFPTALFTRQESASPFSSAPLTSCPSQRPEDRSPRWISSKRRRRPSLIVSTTVRSPINSEHHCALSLLLDGSTPHPPSLVRIYRSATGQLRLPDTIAVTDDQCRATIVRHLTVSAPFW
jgi:hypothetical protein